MGMTSGAAQFGVAVIGSSGHAARVAAPTIHRALDAHVAGVLGSTSDGSEALAAQYAGAVAYPDWDALCADESAQAVWIAGPNGSHAEFAARCLRAGKHVLLEKPLATSVEDARRLVRVAEETGKVLLVDFQHRFRAAHLWMGREIRSGRLGTPALLRIHRFWRYPYYPDMPADISGSWRASSTDSGGWALNDIGSHLVDLALWFAGQPASLAFSRTANHRFTEVSPEDTAILVLDLEGGGTIVIETSNAMLSFPGTIEAHGSEGWMRADETFDGGGTVRLSTGESRSFPPISHDDAYDASFAQFYAATRGQEHAGVTPEQALASLEIVHAAASRHRR